MRRHKKHSHMPGALPSHKVFKSTAVKKRAAARHPTGGGNCRLLGWVCVYVQALGGGASSLAGLPGFGDGPELRMLDGSFGRPSFSGLLHSYDDCTGCPLLQSA